MGQQVFLKAASLHLPGPLTSWSVWRKHLNVILRTCIMASVRCSHRQPRAPPDSLLQQSHLAWRWRVVTTRPHVGQDGHRHPEVRCYKWQQFQELPSSELKSNHHRHTVSSAWGSPSAHAAQSELITKVREALESCAVLSTQPEAQGNKRSQRQLKLKALASYRDLSVNGSEGTLLVRATSPRCVQAHHCVSCRSTRPAQPAA